MRHCTHCHPYGEKAAEHQETLPSGEIISCDAGHPHTPELCTRHFGLAAEVSAVADELAAQAREAEILADATPFVTRPIRWKGKGIYP